MRNRGIEIFLLPPREQQAAPAAAPGLCQHGELQQVLALAGIPGTAIPAAMAAAHAAVVAHAAQRHRRPPGLRELRRWAALAAALAGRGWPFAAALHTAWRQLYVRSEAVAAAGADEASAVAEAAFEVCVLPQLQHADGSGGDLVLHRPAAWPLPLGAAEFAADSAGACLGRDAAVLLQHLAVLAAAQQQQHGSSDGGTARAELGSSRDAWVGELGLAAAAAMPAAQLVQLLSGGGLPGSSMDSDVEAASESDAPAALLCAPPAARVFAERCGAAHGGRRAAHAAALAAQLQRLLGAGSGASSQALTAAHLAERMVSGVLAHPLAAAAAALQQQLAAAVQLPEADRAFLPLDAAGAQQLQPYMLAAGLRADGDASSASASLQQLWQQVMEVSGKVAALWHAVHAAVELRSVAAAADEAVADGSATLLQLSCWRHQRPKVRLAGTLLCCLCTAGRGMHAQPAGRVCMYECQQPNWYEGMFGCMYSTSALARLWLTVVPCWHCRSGRARQQYIPPWTGCTLYCWRYRCWRRRCWCLAAPSTQARPGAAAWPTR